MRKVYDVIIIGGGPAGLTAAIYCARDNKKVLVLEKEVAGGKIMETPEVNNIPGFLEISGADFGERLREQATSFGAKIEYDEVIDVDIEDDEDIIAVETDNKTYYGLSCIIATGTKNRMLGLPGEEDLVGNGVHFCVTCDGIFYKDKTVAVIGGGNSALTEALELSKIAKKVLIIQNLPALTGEKSLVNEVMSTDNIEVILEATVAEIHKFGPLVYLDLSIDNDPIKDRLQVDGVFEAIGLIPQNTPFKKVTYIDNSGYIVSSLYANILACGDCTKNSIQQVAVACGEGAKAALNILRYLRGREVK